MNQLEDGRGRREGEDMEIKNSYTPLLGILISTAILETSKVVLLKTRSAT